MFLGAHSAFGEMYDNKLACEKIKLHKKFINMPRQRERATITGHHERSQRKRVNIYDP